MVCGWCCSINGAGSVMPTSQAGHASGHLYMWVPRVFRHTRDARPHLRPPLWYLGLRLKLVQRAMVSAMVVLWELRNRGLKWGDVSHPAQRGVSASEKRAEGTANRQKKRFPFNLHSLVFERYWSCLKLSAVTWEGVLTCACSAGFEVSPCGKGLMEGKGEQGKHNWRLAGWGTKPAGNIAGIKYVICDWLKNVLKISYSISIIECNRQKSVVQGWYQSWRCMPYEGKIRCFLTPGPARYVPSRSWLLSLRGMEKSFLTPDFLVVQGNDFSQLLSHGLVPQQRLQKFGRKLNKSKPAWTAVNPSGGGSFL